MPAVKECFDVTMASASLEILSVMIIIQKIVTTVQMKSIVEERLNLPEKVISLLNYNSAPNARLNQVPSNYILETLGRITCFVLFWWIQGIELKGNW